MIDPTSKLVIEALVDEVKRLIDTEEYDVALQALDGLLGYVASK